MNYKVGHWSNDIKCSDGRVLKRINIVVMVEGHDLPIATLTAGEIIHQQEDGSDSTHTEVLVVCVDLEHRRKGIATKMYDLAGELLGCPITPSDELSDDAIKFWMTRDPLLDEVMLRDERCYGVMPADWVPRQIIQVPINWQK